MKDVGKIASPQAVFFLGKDDDGAAFGGFVGQGRELCGVGQALLADVRRGVKFGGLAVAESDGSSLVEEQGADVTRGFHGTPAHGEYVVLNETIHAGDADGREQATDGGGDEAHQQRDEHEDGLRCLRVNRKGL